MDFSIVIVSWNVKDKLRENLLSLQLTRDVSFEIFVVDNASADGTALMIKTEFKDVKLIANQENLGFAKANNLALSKARGDYLLLLNPDMKVKPETLSNLLAWLKVNPQAAITGCHLLDENGLTLPHVRRFPRLTDQAAIAAKLPHFFPHLLDGYLRRDFDYLKASRVDSIRGSFFCLTRETYLTLGGLDERYFVWFEEVDYCLSASRAGLEVWYTPAAECIDYIGQAFKQLPAPKKQLIFKESMIKYFTKWHGRLATLIIRLAWMFGSVVFFLATSLNLKSKSKT